MYRLAKLVALALSALGAASAHAGYAQLAPPAGFGGSPAGWTLAPAANDAVFDRVIHQPNGLKVPIPGTPTSMPASYRLAANAPRIAAAVIFANPYVRVAVGIATWLGVAKVVYDVSTGTWRQEREAETANGWLYKVGSGQEYTSAEAACGAAAAAASNTNWKYSIIAVEPGRCQQQVQYNDPKKGWTDSHTNYIPYTKRQVTNQQPCPTGWTPSAAGCLSPQLTQPQMVELLNPANQTGWPMPSTVPKELPPGTPLPIEPPVINPAPGPNPVPRPLFVPTGNPIPNPNHDPNQYPTPENAPYLQPGVRVTPAPTPQEPLRVDLQPLNRPTQAPNPSPGPVSDEGPTPGDKPKTDEQQSLCEKHPEIVACAQMDDVQPQDVNKQEKTVTITPKTGWGNESASCPAPVTKQVAGLNLEMSWEPFCDFASGIRPVVIAMAWLGAALMVLGIARKD